MFILSDEQKNIKSFILNNKRCNVFAGCGKGKTLATLSAICEMPERPILIVAPLRVASHGWEQQGAQFSLPLTFSKMIGTEEERIRAYNQDADIYLINYENLKWLDATLPFKFKAVVCDEATKIKNHQVYTRNDKLVARNGRNSTALVRHCTQVKRWINLTATPIHNHLKDLWGLQFPVDFGKALGKSRQQFLDRYFITYRFKNHLPATYHPKATTKIAVINKIKPTSITIRSDEKKPKIIDIKLNLPTSLHKTYKNLEKTKSFKTDDGEVIFDHVGIKQRQYTSGFMLNSSGQAVQLNDIKKQALMALLQKINGNVIIVYQFKEEARMLQELLPSAKRLDVATEKTLKQWNAGELKYLLIHPLSAGHGINLQHGGNKMVFYTTDWDAELFAQTIERIGTSRQKLSGYDRDVFIYRFVTAGTIDTRIVKRLQDKLKNAV